jgi:predicted RNase H-like HicB family nuclease
MTDRYHVNIMWSDEDQCWIADVPDLRFCSAHGDTREAALLELEIAMRAWLGSARDRGAPIPPPKYRPAIYTLHAAA